MPEPQFIHLERAEVEGLLARAQAALSPEDYARLAGLVATLSEVTRLVHQQGTTIARLRHLLGGRTSEKTADVLGTKAADGAAGSSERGHPPPSGTGEEPDGGEAHGVGEGEGSGERSRRGHERRPASAYSAARRVEVAHESLAAGHPCPACARGQLYRLPEPAPRVRIEGQPPLVATVWELERLRCTSCGRVYTAQAPEEARGPKYSDSAASMMAVLRYGAGMPLHRLARLQGDLETPLPASTQWEVVEERIGALRPAHQELIRQAAAGTVVYNDDTSMRILEFMGKRRAKLLARGELPDPERTGLFTTAVVSRTDAGPIALFFTGRRHAGENLAELLDQRATGLPPPIQMCDALPRNRSKGGHPVQEANCLAHGRRHIVDEADNFPEECRHVLETLCAVFNNEAIAKRQGLSDEERLRFHQRESGPLMDGLETWLRDQLDQKRVEPNSGLGEAFRYLLAHWDKLFYRTLHGAHVGDVYMTLIHTAELHGVNPFDYLTTLEANAKAVAASPGDWLPWNYKATLAALARDQPQAA